MSVGPLVRRSVLISQKGRGRLNFYARFGEFVQQYAYYDKTIRCLVVGPLDGPTRLVCHNFLKLHFHAPILELIYIFLSYVRIFYVAHIYMYIYYPYFRNNQIEDEDLPKVKVPKLTICNISTGCSRKYQYVKLSVCAIP